MAEAGGGRKEQRKRKIQDFTRDHILNAAVRVIEERGLEKATMDEIAREAGYGVGTLYNYFKSKDELSLALLRKVFGEVEVTLATAPPAGLGAEEALAWSLARVFALANRNRGLMFELITRSHRVGADAAGMDVDEMHGQAKRMDAVFREIVGRSLRGHKTWCGRAEAAGLLAALVRGFIAHKFISGGGSLEPEVDAGRIVRAFLRGVLDEEA